MVEDKIAPDGQLGPVYTSRDRHHHHQIYIVLNVTDCLMDRWDSESILSIKWSISIGIMLNFDGHGLDDGICEQVFYF